MSFLYLNIHFIATTRKTCVCERERVTLLFCRKWNYHIGFDEMFHLKKKERKKEMKSNQQRGKLHCTIAIFSCLARYYDGQKKNSIAHSSDAGCETNYSSVFIYREFLLALVHSICEKLSSFCVIVLEFPHIPYT